MASWTSQVTCKEWHKQRHRSWAWGWERVGTMGPSSGRSQSWNGGSGERIRAFGVSVSSFSVVSFFCTLPKLPLTIGKCKVIFVSFLKFLNLINSSGTQQTLHIYSSWNESRIFNKYIKPNFFRGVAVLSCHPQNIWGAAIWECHINLGHSNQESLSLANPQTLRMSFV